MLGHRKKQFESGKTSSSNKNSYVRNKIILKFVTLTIQTAVS